MIDLLAAFFGVIFIQGAAAPGGADPSIASHASTDCATASSCSVTYPGTISADDWLVIWLSLDSSGSSNWACTGFTLLSSRSDDPTLALLYKVATGSESGTVSCTWDGSEAGGAVMVAVTDADRFISPIFNMQLSDVSLTPPPPVNTPVTQALVITGCNLDGSGNESATAPSGYTLLYGDTGCDTSGCASMATAWDDITSGTSELPGDFDWSPGADTSVCATMAFDNGTGLQSLFAHNFDSTVTAGCYEEGATSASGTPDCDYTTVQPQGAQSAMIDADLDAVETRIFFEQAFEAQADGCMYWDFYLHADSIGTSSTTFFASHSTAAQTGPELRFDGTSEWDLRCDNAATTAGTFTPAADTTYKVRLEYCMDGGPGSCGVIATDCIDCGCLTVDVVGNDFGDTQVDSCDGEGTPAGINGMRWRLEADSMDLVIDDLGVCDGASGAAKCGD